MDENETKSSLDLPSDALLTHPTLDGRLKFLNLIDLILFSIENPPIKSEPVCVFVNRTFDSSDSELPTTVDEGHSKK
jgi:hypothetical protein